MRKEIVKNKDGEVLRNKTTNEELVNNWFEVDDEFIPVMNKVFERSHDAIVKGKNQTIVNYSILASVRDKDGTKIEQKGKDEIFVNVTPTQAKSLNSKIESGVEINQQLWRVYSYESKMYGSQIGVGLKGQFKQPKKFEDFDSVKFNDAVDVDAIEEDNFENK